MTQSDARNPVDHPVFESMQKRWSPYRFEPRGVEPEKLRHLFEAARWAASSFNDQPWSWIVARREDESDFETMVGCLMEANRGWASQAGVLVLTAIRTSFAYNGKPNRVALHDLGQAACQMSLEATRHGLQVHQMAGINLSAIKQKYGLPDGVEPQTAIAIGYPNQSEPQSDAERGLADRESGPRTRKQLSEQVFSGKFGQVANFLS